MSLACTLFAPLDLRVTQYQADEPGEGEVRVRLGAGGICGSDLHYYEHGRAGIFALRAPFIPGHEASGIVEAVGPTVTRVKPGQKVAVNPSHPCGHCSYCREGRGNLCTTMIFMGSAAIFPHLPGLFREHFIVGEKQLTPIDEPDITLGEIACAEPLSIGMHAILRAGSVFGKTVLITGGGTIGCMTVIAARIAGAAQIIVCDIHDRALNLAQQVGANRGVRIDQITPEQIVDCADVSIEAAGSPAAVQTCLKATRRGGTIVQVGTLASDMLFPANQVMSRELNYVGAFRAHAAFDWAVQAIRTRRADVRALISAQLPLSQSKEAFDLARDRTRHTKVQLVLS
ncbi:MAG: L-idonate 5-dehydrogenase [Alcaligenaceae bacterium]